MTLPASIRRDAATLSARLPSLVIAARRVAQTVRHGVHGRRRAGSGETFWQFRPFCPASRRRESTGVVRRVKSALSCASASGRPRIRSGSGSIARPRCNSHRVWRRSSKIDRAALLALAFADLCVRGGERAGLLGLTRPLATQGVVERFAEAIATEERLRGPLASRVAARAARRAALDGSHDRRFSLGSRRCRARDAGRERGGRDWRTGDDRRSDRGDLSVLRQHRVSPSRRFFEHDLRRGRKTCATPISRALPRIEKRSGGSAPARAGV